MSETAISKTIRDAIRKAGWQVERINSGKVKVRGAWMHLASAGVPDLLVFGKRSLSKCGHAVFGWLETKTDIGKLSDVQIKWHAMAESMGINVAVVRSARDALDAVKEWEKAN